MKDIWLRVLADMETETSRITFNTWLSGLDFLGAENGKIELGVPNVFHIKPLGKYTERLKELFKKYGVEAEIIDYKLNKGGTVKTRSREVIRDEAGREITTERENRPATKTVMNNMSAGFETGLNQRFTMDGFVIGSNNDLAVSVAKHVIEHPGEKYNPFFLYGGPGLGKTHLVQAIGNALLARNPKMKILYTPINHFYSEFVNAIRVGNMDKFAQKFRKLDVLIIDDFQFIVGKEKSQEEFFNIFNDLYQLNKQIIVTSDRLPSQIKSVDERLASRLTWAGAIDLQLPNFEDKCAILKAKAEIMGVEIEDEAIEYLAENIKTNIRDLEGEFNRVLAVAELKNLSPMQLINGGYVNTIEGSKKKTTTPKQVVEKIAKHYNLSVKEMCGKSRVAHIKTARQVAMFILAEELGMSTTKIAGEVGVKDHTTVMHGIKKIKSDLKLNFGLRDEIAAIREKIYG